ncbi:hypothetical protein [uncultured Algimonas sp.]|uniref:hypothetical protein n=1 Tax=uncultured Algimonas sp. TaxID=1547920 RepID=UPI00261D5812|nr:hypothetical protein [uncultured Algimonas sp.]
MIVEAQVHNKVSDLGLLCETAEVAENNLGVHTIESIADRSYYKIEHTKVCEAAGTAAYVAKLVRSPGIKAGLFPKDTFTYDATTDTLSYPSGETLLPRYKEAMRGTKAISYVNRSACRTCDMRAH